VAPFLSLAQCVVALTRPNPQQRQNYLSDRNLPSYFLAMSLRCQAGSVSGVMMVVSS
jgi:hypothetical protein